MPEQGSSEVKIALHEQRIGDLEEEQIRTRDRLHTLEQDRIALKLMAQQMEGLAESLRMSTATLARLDAKVTELVIAQARDEGEDAHRRDWLSSRRFVTGVLIASAGVIVSLVSTLLTILLN